MPDAPGGAAAPKRSGSLLTRKLGPLPVWLYALLILVGAWVYARYRNNKASASTATTSSSAAPEGQAVAPQFVIENNLPPVISGSNQPVPTPTTNPPPVVTPPGKGPKPPTGGHKPKPPTRKPGGGHKPPIKYRVEHGDTLTSIAQAHGLSEHELWEFNTDPKNRNASAIATLKRRGEGLIFAGEEILIPQK